MERDGQGRRTLWSVWPQAEAEPGNLKSDLDKARVRQRTGVGPLHLSLFFSCFLRFLGLLPVSLARHWYSCGYLELRSSDKQPKQTWKSLQTANIQQKQQIMEIFIRCNFKTKLSVCYQNHRVIGVQKFLFTAVILLPLSHLKWHFHKLFARLEAKARRSLLPRFCEKKPTSFGFELQVASNFRKCLIELLKAECSSYNPIDSGATVPKAKRLMLTGDYMSVR